MLEKEKNIQKQTEDQNSKVYFFKSKSKNVVILRNILRITMIFFSAFYFLEVLLSTSLFVYGNYIKFQDQNINVYLLIYVISKWFFLFLYFYIISFLKKQNDENKLYSIEFWKIFVIFLFSIYLIFSSIDKIDFKNYNLVKSLLQVDWNIFENKQTFPNLDRTFQILNIFAIIVNFLIIMILFMIFILKPKKNIKKIPHLKIVINKK